METFEGQAVWEGVVHVFEESRRSSEVTDAAQHQLPLERMARLARRGAGQGIAGLLVSWDSATRHPGSRLASSCKPFSSTRHLPRVAKRHRSNRAQIWKIHPTEQRPRPIAEFKDRIERNSGMHVDDFRLSRADLSAPVLPT
jgi:hypothetical protein